MAEVIGTVSAVAGIFTTCVQGLQWVRLGLQFGEHFDENRLQLDLAVNRFTRWGEWVQISSDKCVLHTASRDQVQLAYRCLAQTKKLIDDAQQLSEKYEIEFANEQGSLPEEFPESNMEDLTKRLSKKLRLNSRRRQKKVNFIKGCSWVFYHHTEFGAMLTKINGFTESLERLDLSAPVPQQELVKADMQDFKDTAELQKIARSAETVDPAMARTAQVQKAFVLNNTNSAGAIDTDETSSVRIGNNVSGVHWASANVLSQSDNSADSIRSRGGSSVHIGDVFS